MILPERIPFIGAHSDDVERLAGGLLARACFEGGRRIGVLVFTDHRRILDEATAVRALDEFRENVPWLRAEAAMAFAVTDVVRD